MINYRAQLQPILNYYLVQDCPWLGSSDLNLHDSATVDSRWCKIIKKGPGAVDIDGGMSLMIPEVGDTVFAAVHGKANLENIERDCSLYMLSSLDIMGILRGEDVEPLGQLVYIKLDSLEEKTESDLIIPGKKRSLPNKGVVKAVGKGWMNWNGQETEFQVKPGDHVIFDGFSTIKVDWNWMGLDNEDYILIQHTSIYGIITPESEE